jgi:hypothetical protein
VGGFGLVCEFGGTRVRGWKGRRYRLLLDGWAAFFLPFSSFLHESFGCVVDVSKFRDEFYMKAFFLLGIKFVRLRFYGGCGAALVFLFPKTRKTRIMSVLAWRTLIYFPEDFTGRFHVSFCL